MKQYSPARLRQPLKRRPGSERGAGEFVPIGWDEALDLLTARLAKIRATNPTELAFFTGRDQMQALSSLWAQQFGTPNWAAHGGLCSVNMAVAGLYTIGYSFWEFGAPDWDHAKYFILWGVAEDHSSNPLKIGLDKLKRRGAKFVSINPVRTGYSAIADEWIPIRPGNRRAAGPGHRARAAQARARRLGIPHPLHQRALACRADARHARRRPVCARRRRQSPGLGYPRTPLCQRRICPTLRRRCSLRSTSPTAVAPRPFFRSSRSATLTSAMHRKPSPPNAASPRRRSIASPWKWRTSRSTRRSNCRSPGPTCTAAATTGSSAARWRCMPCAASRRIPTAFTPAARCMCCRCCWAHSTAPATSAQGPLIRGASRCARCRKTIPRSSSRRIRR